MAMRARAIWFREPRAVEIREEDLPPPGAGEVLVQTVCSAVSHGTEMLVYRGEVDPRLPLDLPALRGGFAFPVKYGYACVGRVTAAGPGVAGLHPGDLVFAHHPHQTAFTLPAGQVVPLPPGCSPEEATLLANLETAVTALLDAAPRVGECAAVLGQGTVGLLVAQLLRRIPGVAVVAVEPLARRRAVSRTVGIPTVLNPAQDDVAAVVRTLTGGRGADLVVEASGAPAALQGALELAGLEGRVVVLSWYGQKPVTLDLGGAFHRRRLRLVASQVGHLPAEVSARWDRARRLEVARALLAEGELRLAPLITHRIPFDRAREAYALVDRHPEETVQVVLTYDGGAAGAAGPAPGTGR